MDKALGEKIVVDEKRKKRRKKSNETKKAKKLWKNSSTDPIPTGGW